MEVVHFSQKQLAARWVISEATLERWRSEGIGPRFLKLCGRVLYRKVDIEAYEESCLAISTASRADRARVYARDSAVSRLSCRSCPRKGLLQLVAERSGQ